MAKDCKLSIKCTECESDRHLAALHVEKPLKPENRERAQGGENGNGQQASSQQERTDGADQQHLGEHSQVTTSCTEICGGRASGRSCMCQDMFSKHLCH